MVKPLQRRVHERGDISIFMALIMLSIILTSALLFNFILTRQLKQSATVVDSERAFYAANSGLEHSLYELAERFPADCTPFTGSVDYGEAGLAPYTSRAKYIASESGESIVDVMGEFGSQDRRIKLGAGECEP